VTPTRSITRTLLSVAVAGVVLAGCGDDGGGEAISKDEFVEEANEICASNAAALEEEAEQLGPSPSEDDRAEFLGGTLVPNVQTQIEDIRGLGFPEGDEEELDAVLSDAEEILDDIEADPAEYVDGEDPFTEVNAALDEYGLTECGSG
jgi:hypothetical protein